MHQEVVAIGESASHLAQPDSFLLADGSVDKKSVVMQNKTAILAALKGFGVVTAVVSYYGEGDEGSIVGIELTPADTPALSSMVTMKALSSSFNGDSQEWTHHVSEKTLDLDTALRDFAEDLIEFHGHSAYGDQDGGGGDVTFDVEGDSVAHDHFDNVIETVHDINEL